MAPSAQSSKSAPKSGSKSKAPSKAPSKSPSKAPSAPKSGSKKAPSKPSNVQRKEPTYDGMKHMANIEWDMNQRAPTAMIKDGKDLRPLSDDEKIAKVFTLKEQEEFTKTHKYLVVINPNAGLKKVEDPETGKEQELVMVGVDRVSPKIGLNSLLTAISKMSPSTGNEKFALKGKKMFAGLEKVKCSNDADVPPIFIVKMK